MEILFLFPFPRIVLHKFSKFRVKKFNPKLNDKNFIERAYGVSFELPSAVLETILNINEKDDVYKFRHILVFLVFFCLFNAKINFLFSSLQYLITNFISFANL